MLTIDSVPVLCLLVTITGVACRVAFILGKINISLGAVTKQITKTHTAMEEHSKTCDTERVRFDTTLHDHERRIGTLEQ